MTGTYKYATDKQIFSTKEAAEICGVSLQTIIRCFDSGRLEGFRVPGSRTRRIPRDSLVRFMKANAIPITALAGPQRRILLSVAPSDKEAARFADLLNCDARFEAKLAANAFESGFLAREFRPHLILIDHDLPGLDGDLVCDWLRRDSESSSTKVVVWVGNASRARNLADASIRAGEEIRKPLASDALIDRVADLLGV